VDCELRPFSGNEGEKRVNPITYLPYGRHNCRPEAIPKKQ